MDQSIFSQVFGEGTAEAAEPAEYKGPVVRSIKDPVEYTGPVTPISPAKTSAPEPFGARAASWLPTVGQFGGEALGATAGAAVPGLGETGASEYGGAVAGGALGSAGGAMLENRIRKAYGLAPVSVGEEALWGGAGTAVGGALPSRSRFRKAAKIVKATGKDWGTALREAQQAEAMLEQTVGMHPRKAALLKSAPAQATRDAYFQTREAGLKELGGYYDKLLAPFSNTKTPDTVRTALQGHAGKMLEISGKPLREAVEQQITGQPMTVRRAQRVLSLIRSYKRGLNPETQRMALGALNELEQAVKADIRSVVGPNVAQTLDNLDAHYARQMARYPVRAIKQAFTEPQAAEAILTSKPGDVGRVVEIIRDMEQRGQGDVLKRATAARIFQKAAVEAAQTPGERLDVLQKAVSSIKPEVFDSLYGAGARETWLRTAKSVATRHAELLKNPDEAAAIANEVRKYLQQPGVFGRMAPFFGHRVAFGALMAGAGYEFGETEIAAAGAALLGIESYELMAHSPQALKLLEKAATSKDARLSARLIIAAIDASMRAGVESAANAK